MSSYWFRQKNKLYVLCRRRYSESSFHERIPDGWDDLAQAIILLAVRDYRKSLRALGKRPDDKEWRKKKESCERFFRSRWFGALTEADPDLILEGLQKEVAV